MVGKSLLSNYGPAQYMHWISHYQYAGSLATTNELYTRNELGMNYEC